MLTTPASDESPIFESIQSIAVRAFGALPESNKDRRLVIASDMLQNTPEYSQYHGIGSFEEFKRSQYYRRVRADLRGVEVELYYFAEESASPG